MRKVIFPLLLLLPSCKAYVSYNPKLDKEDLPKQCVELHDFVTENWVRHRKLMCHRFFTKVEAFPYQHKDCLLSLQRAQIEQLFGRPDDIQFGSYYYYFKKDCENKNEYGVYFFQVAFDGENVSQVDAGEMEYKEIK